MTRVESIRNEKLVQPVIIKEMRLKTILRLALLLGMSIMLFLNAAATGICALMCVTNTCPGCATWAIQSKAPAAQTPEKPCCCKHCGQAGKAAQCSSTDGGSKPSCCKFKTPQLAVNIPVKSAMPIAALTVIDLPKPALPDRENTGNEYSAAVPEVQGHSPPPIVPYAPDLGRAPPAA